MVYQFHASSFCKRLSWGWGGHKQNSIIMKKFFLFSLLCVISHLLAYSDVTKNVTMYVGETLVIDPYIDSGITPSISKYVRGANVYNLSDPSMFTVTTTSYRINNKDQTMNYTTKVFTLLAIKTGICTFSSSVNYSVKKNGVWTGQTEQIIYNITVIERPKVVSIAIPNTLTLTVGEGYTFSPIINESGAETTLSWYSSNTSVATVDANGYLYANGTGTTSITCIADNGVSAQCFVTVNAFVDPLPAVKDTTVNLTVTVGIPFVITPIHELNIAGGDASTPTPYVLSDPSACTVTYTDCPGWNENIYRIYTITPERAGVFVFKETCSCTIGYPSAPSGIYTKTATATYIVNAVEALPTVLGDMDGDGKVTVSDVTKVIDIYLEGTGE